MQCPGGTSGESKVEIWGAFLLNRMMRKQGYDPATIDPMTRLAIVGSSGRGGLRYEPELRLGAQTSYDDDLDTLARLYAQILDGKPVDDLDEAYALGGSSAGARPKAYLAMDGIEWLIKFPSSMDPKDIGKMEYEYSCVAKACGIDMPPTKLFASEKCAGYFGVRRFDRDEHGNGIHMVTASGMLEVSHRVPALDYRHLFQVTHLVTHDIQQLWALYKLMCFNVFAHNQDDHSNNFAWLCEQGVWRLSPAYDLTYSTSFGNEHTTTIHGSGNPRLEDILAIANEVGLPQRKAKAVAQEIQAACAELLNKLDLPE